jgi:glutamate synthase (NADPH/NADH) small chain
VLGLIEPAVTIKDIECSIIDKAWAEGWVTPQAPAERTGKKVAVVGSGPAGLAAADQLNQAGHLVTLFERADRPGGLLMYGIPNMKLEKQVVTRRVQLMQDEGVVLKCGVEIGVDISSKQLMEEFDSVVLCCGATKPRDLPIEGRELNNIRYAMEFLGPNTKELWDIKDGKSEQFSELAKGKNVVIIGGGDTGTDCVGTSLRHGCKSVVQLEIMPKPPTERAANNPWPEWPKTYKMDYGQEEAEAIQGEDPRQYLVSSSRFAGDADDNVKAVHIHNIEWTNDNGRFIPKKVEGSERVLDADLVLLAMGFLGPEATIAEELGLDLDARSNVQAEYGKFKTSLDSVFAAGDMRRGQSLIVWAINEGRAVARECDKFLMGATKLP